ncbi:MULTISPECIES: hypothetical protein [unclassified Microcoleus]|nr:MULTISPECIES: hypothetical protein [unclassified Microcoleus]
MATANTSVKSKLLVAKVHFSLCHKNDRPFSKFYIHCQPARLS